MRARLRAMSELDEILGLLTERVSGTVTAAVVGSDGLVIEQAPATGAEFASAAAELALVVTGPVARLAAALGTGQLSELQLRFEQRQLLVKLLGGGLYLVLVLDDSGDTTSARQLIERASAGLTRALV